MASILDRYGIKEVADVVFLEIEEDGSATKPVLFLDTLKISTIEETAEQVEARGGKGNPPLIIWDYGKEITVTLQDALYSPKSMALMHGDLNELKTDTKNAGEVSTTITKYKNVVGTGAALPTEEEATVIEVDHGFVGSASIPKGTVTAIYDEYGQALDAVTATLTKGKRYIVEYTVTAEAGSVSQITINAATFPGTYKVIGDTYARSDVTGKDQFFQFIIEKAKMGAETTITLEAEGDPSVFDMTLRVLRPDNGEMMKLLQYNIAAAGAEGRSAYTLGS